MVGGGFLIKPRMKLAAYHSCLYETNFWRILTGITWFFFLSAHPSSARAHFLGSYLKVSYIYVADQLIVSFIAAFLDIVQFTSFSPNQRFLFGLPIGRAFSGWIDTVPTTHCASWGIERWEDTKLVRRTSEFNLRNGIFSVIVALDHNPSAALVLHFSHDLRWNHWQDHM